MWDRQHISQLPIGETKYATLSKKNHNHGGISKHDLLASQPPQHIH